MASNSEMIVPPFAVIDFEASSLSLSVWPEVSSYPIEVGVAMVDADGGICTWSSLIRPSTLWTAQGEWDRKSERVHGITREELGTGRSIVDVSTMLNNLLGPLGQAWCDGGRYDQHWLDVLFTTAGLTPTFVLRDIGEVLGREGMERERYLVHIHQHPIDHRATADARRICEALLAVLSA